MRTGTLLALLGVLVGGGLAAWWVVGRSDRPARTPATVNDDLDLVMGLLDGAAAEPPRDVLVATLGDRYLARASDGAVVAVAANGRETRTLAILEAPARAMAFSEHALWVAAGRTITRVPVLGGPATPVARDLQRPHAIAAGGGAVFFVDVEAVRGGLTRANVVVRVPSDGGQRTVLGRADGEVTNLVLDDATVYWADRLEGTIVAAPRSGGPSRVLATGRGLPGAIAADADALYWVEKRSESLWMMPKAGGAPRQLTQDFAGFANLLVDARGVVWTNEAALDGLFRVLVLPRDGGDVRLVSPAVEAVDALASDGATLWWDRGGVVSEVVAQH
jgi:hypothetical protein